MNKQINVTVSRIPESEIEEMENYFEAVFDERELNEDMLQIFRMLVIGYGASWDELARRDQDSISKSKLKESISNIIYAQVRAGTKNKETIRVLSTIIDAIDYGTFDQVDKDVIGGGSGE